MWHVSSSSGEAGCKLLYPVILICDPWLETGVTNLYVGITAANGVHDAGNHLILKI